MMELDVEMVRGSWGRNGGYLNLPGGNENDGEEGVGGCGVGECRECGDNEGVERRRLVVRRRRGGKKVVVKE